MSTAFKKADEIIREVCEHAGISYESITNKVRTRNLTKHRHFAMWRVRNEAGLSYSEIGRIFNRHHASVLYAIHKLDWEQEIETHKEFQKLLKEDDH